MKTPFILLFLPVVSLSACAQNAPQMAAAQSAPLIAQPAGVTGFGGGEPANYAHTFYVDAAAKNGDGSRGKPLATISQAFELAKAKMSAGESVHVLIKPGIYDENVAAISSGIGEKIVVDGVSYYPSSDLKLQDAWFKVQRWGAAGEVVIRGSDDWSQGQRQWTPVAGQKNLYRTDWDYNWGVWGGNGGSANVKETAGQRREMVWIDLDKNGAKFPMQRLTPSIIEKYGYQSVIDRGDEASWAGSGKWKYQGFAGLDAIAPGTFVVAELGDSADDAKAKVRLVDPDDAGLSVETSFADLFKAQGQPAQKSAPFAVWDKMGQQVWFNRVTRDFDGDGLGGENPWFKRPLDYAQADSKGKDGVTVTYRFGDQKALFAADHMEAYRWGGMIWNYGEPLAEWRNPTGKNVTVKVAGTLGAQWRESADKPIDLVVAKRAANGSVEALWSETVEKPAQSDRADVVVEGLDAVKLAAGESLLVGHRLDAQGHKQQSVLNDDLTITLTAAG